MGREELEFDGAAQCLDDSAEWYYAGDEPHYTIFEGDIGMTITEINAPKEIFETHSATSDLQITKEALNGPAGKPFDPVDRPKHYARHAVQPIDMIGHWGLGFDLGNALKYMVRAGAKDPNKTVEDLKKAVWYIQHHIDVIQGNVPVINVDRPKKGQ